MKLSNFQSVTFIPLAIILMLSCATRFSAQESTLTKAYKNKVIQSIATELKDRYVFPDKALVIANHLISLNSKGQFDKYSDLENFSSALTEHIYEINKDKHISINLRKKETSLNEEENATNWISEKLKRRTLYRRYNANFKNISKLDGNIGYLELRGFYGLNYGQEFADQAMSMLSTSDAIIIDLRNNSGGRGDMVNYLLGHFFEEPIITGRSIKRIGDDYQERTHKTKKYLGENNMPDIPLFILISKKTFSAAEAFSHPLHIYKRATFIGETTKGGLNAGDIIPLNDELQIFIPDVAALPHPVSNTTLEGKGIDPDIKAESSQALDVALQHARKAAQTYKSQSDQKAASVIEELDKIVSNYNGRNEQQIINAYLTCKDHDIIFEEWELNSFGYQLINQKKEDTAEAIFKTNTVLYPNSANVYDSYAEILLQKEEISKAIRNYEKAVEVATKQEDVNLKLYKDNLRKAKAELNN